VAFIGHGADVHGRIMIDSRHALNMVVSCV